MTTRTRSIRISVPGFQMCVLSTSHGRYSQLPKGDIVQETPLVALNEEQQLPNIKGQGRRIRILSSLIPRFKVLNPFKFITTHSCNFKPSTLRHAAFKQLPDLARSKSKDSTAETSHSIHTTMRNLVVHRSYIHESLARDE